MRVSIEDRKTKEDEYEKVGGSYPVCVVLDTLPCRFIACGTWQITTQFGPVDVNNLDI
jgi:hypothetical protein